MITGLSGASTGEVVIKYKSFGAWVFGSSRIPDS